MPAWLAQALQALGDWPIAVFLRDSTAAYATLNAAHILAIALLVGSIATLDLRLLGLFRGAPLGALARPLSGVAASAIVLALATGFLLFSVRPVAYAQNPAFLTKIALVGLGTLNALVLQASRTWRDAREGGPVHPRVRPAALLSLLIWAGAILAGRWIGFLQ
jgi:hypothetical protein